MTAFDRKDRSLRPRTATSAFALLRAFRRKEEGVLAKPMILVTLLMLMVGGIGIDLMRFERDRTVLQYTLDRAVLAAADLDQEFEPEAVVQDYLEKSGLGEYYDTPLVEQGQGFKKVESTIETPFAAQYLQLFGDSELMLRARSRAEESIDDIEITLVLDVSGSMNSNSRLPNLKVAAQEFVDAIGLNTIEGKMSMSIVPYATQVAGPDELYAELNTSGAHPYSNCINFDAADFETSTISLTDSYERTMHFAPWYTIDRRSDDTRLVTLPVCDERASREMMLLEDDADTLKSFIQGLVAEGNTSIDLGMKWGTALLDPSINPAIVNLTTGDDPYIDPTFATRPAAYTDPETLKIIVLMTDGQNTSQYYIRDHFRGQTSDVWYNDTARVYSTYSASRNEYYWHSDGNSLSDLPRWEDHPYGDGEYRKCSYYSCYWQNESGSAERLTYEDLWADTSLRYVSDRLFADWQGTSTARSTYYNGAYSTVGGSTKNNRTQDICDAAKAQGIIVYTIGFEAPSNGQTVLKNCASSDSHFFDVDGLEISDAFASIATSIRQLRLTQ
ncbi:Tad domain-containing protein [Epibacterium ulvae]|uniref:TadE/TadG family type IV pilus assembly protein n=1 Tax=Epibacterium ulvae TaxID=1156985 RepID=UPI001BFC842D|nr:TadE/TadG family type IV pilus assembly protein [Epibacterium ulvae]MBT8154139.1 Tad domain-containing protein [Epibacterium ulvae]